MQIFDMHVHSHNVPAAPERLLSELAMAGVSGCCVFSNRPPEMTRDMGTSFEERLDEITSWTRGYEDRLFPVLWIHPDEENLKDNIRRAVDAGVMAFKVICNNFYVGENKSMDMLAEIERNPDKQWKSKDVAKQLCISVKRLDEYCLSHTAQTFTKFVLKTRMKIAFEMMKSKSLTVAEIASRVGYSTPFSFSRIFKSYYGQAPRNIAM